MNEHSLHSPLVYDYYLSVVRKRHKTDPRIEELRKRLLSSPKKILVKDHGTGKNREPMREIRSIAAHSAAPAWKAMLISETARFFECKKMLELGTSVGLTTLYLSSIPQSQITTFEGSPATLDLAREHFIHLERFNITTVEGNIDETLPEFLLKNGRFDLAYLDANHTYEATVRYFEMLSRKAHDNTIFILDDIYLSPEMTRAWNEICNRTEITLSMDLFHIGILCIDPTLPRKHYILET